MGWKNVKEHYGVVHIVQVTEDGICIGSPYIHDIIVIGLDGVVKKQDDRTMNADLMRYQRDFAADPENLRSLVEAPDSFSEAIPVFTYDGADIIEKRCEALGWPNVTHDGLMMYENMFSANRDEVVEWAKKNCVASMRFWRERIEEQEKGVLASRAKLAGIEANAITLGISAAV
jgi:hypothetical protein